MTASDTPAHVMPVDVTRIMGMLPHRYPFLLVDRVLELDPHKRLRAIKNVTINEPFFQGHFPGHPVMPGVLVIEAMAQAAGLLTQLSDPPRDPNAERRDDATGQMPTYDEDRISDEQLADLIAYIKDLK